MYNTLTSDPFKPIASGVGLIAMTLAPKYFALFVNVVPKVLFEVLDLL